MGRWFFDFWTRTHSVIVFWWCLHVLLCSGVVLCCAREQDPEEAGELHAIREVRTDALMSECEWLGRDG